MYEALWMKTFFISTVFSPTQLYIRGLKGHSRGIISNCLSVKHQQITATCFTGIKLNFLYCFYALFSLCPFSFFSLQAKLDLPKYTIILLSHTSLREERVECPLPEILWEKGYIYSNKKYFC